MSRVLVTGATGFLGKHLVEALVAGGHEVVALARSAAPGLPGGVSIAAGDVLDGESVERAAAGCEAVFHCAGKVSRDRRDAEALHRVHVDGTTTTLDACKRAKVSRAIVASTSGVVAVSEKAVPLAETAPTPTAIIATWPYYRSKLFAERAALERSTDGFEVVAVNPTLLLGPGDERGSSTGDVLDVIEQRLPAIPGGGISFVDARDAAAAMIAAWHAGRPGHRYLLAAQNLTMRAFCEKVARLSGARLPALPLPKSRLLASIGAELADGVLRRLGSRARVDHVSAEMAQYYWYVDSSKAEAELGFAPRDPGETLADTVADLRRRGAAWPLDDATP